MPQAYRKMPALGQVKPFLEYCPKAGIFRWTELAHAKVRGKTAGNRPVQKGYGVIRFAGQLWLTHRLAWYFHYGQDPFGLQIDHINGNRMDNRISNLRLANNQENNCNTLLRSTNSSGYKGVSWMKSYGKWEGYIWRNYKKHLIGYFATAEEAAIAVAQARAEFHGSFANHG